MSMICQQCGKELSDTAKFCSKCGAPQNQPVQEDVTVLIDSTDDTVETGAESYAPKEEPKAAEQHEPKAGPIEETILIEEAAQIDEDAPIEEEPRTAQSEHQYVYQEAPEASWHFKSSSQQSEHTYQQQSQNAYQQQTQNKYQQYSSQTMPWDHTKEFDPQDISDNKVIAMLVYLLGVPGIIIALLGSNHSPYARFHLRQALKFLVIETLLLLVILVLCWTIIVPIIGGLFECVLIVVKIICFFSICNGQAKEPPIIRSFGFLK